MQIGLSQLKLGASTGVGPSLAFDFLAGSLDSKVTFTRASDATYFDANGTLTTAGNNVARFDYDPSTLAARGLLIEEQRTNSIRNNTMQGAVAGTPGTQPTNWNFVAGTTGIASEIVGTGTVNGISYIDIRYSGTAAATASFSQRIETGNSIAALTGQVWAMSAWVKIQAGSTNGVTAINHQYVENTSAGGFVTSGSVAITVDSTFTRQTTSRTLSGGATVAFVTGGISVTVTSGQAIDITLRIGLPQLEQGAFATSVIPTTGSVATRNADAASVTGANFSSWYNASAGTLYSEFTPVGSFNANRAVVSVNDASINNYVAIGTRNGSATYGATLRSSGGTVSQIGSFGAADTTAQKAAIAFTTSDQALSFRGGAVATDTQAIPVVNQLTLGTGTSASASVVQVSAYIRRIAYYPRRLSNAELQAITA